MRFDPVAHFFTRVSLDVVGEVFFRAQDFATEGLVEIRAIAYPTVGQPRLLEPLHLYVFPFGAPTPDVRYIALP